MTYQGPERRKNSDIDLAVSIAEIKGNVEKLDLRINGSMEKIAGFIESGTWYRRLIIGTALSLALSVFSGIATASKISTTLGKYMERVDRNTLIINKLAEERMDDHGMSFKKTS